MVITTQNINQKPGYKQTEVGVIPEEWEAKSIGDLITFSGGSQPPRSTFKFQNKVGYIRLIQIRDYKTEEFETFIPEELARKKCVASDIMIGRYGPPIFQTLRGIEGAYNVALLKAIPSPRIDREYLYHFLKQESLFHYVESLSQRSSGQTGIEMPALKNYPLPLPPLPEQRTIAATLSDVDALITSLDRLIAKKRDIKQSTMQQLLTGKTRLPGFGGEWKEKKFGEIFQFLNTANNSRSDLSENGAIKYIHYGDIHMKWRSFLDCLSDELPLIQSDKVRNVSFLEDGDLVMADASEDNEGIGISVEVKNATSTKVVAGLHTFLLRGNKEVLADGFKGYLQYIPAVKDSLKKAATGISVYGISKNNVRNISICLPDITEQRAIATILSDMDAEIATLEQKRDKTRALKQGMMQELLTGKTRLI